MTYYHIREESSEWAANEWLEENDFVRNPRFGEQWDGPHERHAKRYELASGRWLIIVSSDDYQNANLDNLY